MITILGFLSDQRFRERCFTIAAQRCEIATHPLTPGTAMHVWGVVDWSCLICRHSVLPYTGRKAYRRETSAQQTCTMRIGLGGQLATSFENPPFVGVSVLHQFPLRISWLLVKTRECFCPSERKKTWPLNLLEFSRNSLEGKRDDPTDYQG